ncbi:MAG: 16S rRNA processing protein RimM [Firmicutes bacterium ZCTH02-B6]|nr:MAG: 16S rRNA processing protein RimM [Firmicutes bacterium ZCTH02-B6]
MADYVTIGEVLSAHGVRGTLKVKPLTAYPERFLGLERVFVTVTAPDGLAKREERAVEDTRLHRGVVLVKLAGIDDRETAKGLSRALLQVAAAEVHPLPPGEYYIFDIIGLSVYDETGRCLGVVRDVLETGANDVYVIARSDGEGELLLPAVQDVVQRIDLAQGRMDVRLLPGLE